VVAPGSVARTLPIPGLAECGIGFKTIGEAIYLRNHVLSRLDAADTTIDPTLRSRLLTFMVVGGGYAGVEALAELADMARYASKYYPTIDREDIRWILVEASGRIMPEVSPKMGRYTVERLLDADIEVNLDTRVKSMAGGHVELDDGQEFDTDTIIWTAGVKPSPMLDQTDLPRDSRGRVECGADLDRRRVLVRRARLRDHGVDEKVATVREVLGHLADDRGALRRGCLRPHSLVETAARGADRLLDLRGRRGLHLGDGRLGRGVLDRERRAVSGDVLSVDERLTRLYQCNHLRPLFANLRHRTERSQPPVAEKCW
jgi:NADPH-dependent 2,4-dienoyl-CoA reductase/sulfur reductase-like enzyme